mgnify:CR=1 FL=1
MNLAFAKIQKIGQRQDSYSIVISFFKIFAK